MEHNDASRKERLEEQIRVIEHEQTIKEQYESGMAEIKLRATICTGIIGLQLTLLSAFAARMFERSATGRMQAVLYAGAMVLAFLVLVGAREEIQLSQETVTLLSEMFFDKTEEQQARLEELRAKGAKRAKWGVWLFYAACAAVALYVVTFLSALVA